MTESSLGTKRRCTACEAAFYDLGRRPIVCPKCGAPHQPVTRLKSDGRTPPKGRTAPKPQPVVVAAPVAAAEADEAALEEAGLDDVAPEDDAEEEEDAVVVEDDADAEPGVVLDDRTEDR